MSINPLPLTVVKPGEGSEGTLGSIGVAFKLWGGDTGGAVSIVEHPFPVGALVLPHLHTREDEYSIVTEGEIGFRSGDSEVVLGAGGYITKPRNEMHAMWNAGDVPARMIEVISQQGLRTSSRKSQNSSPAVHLTWLRSRRLPQTMVCSSARRLGSPTLFHATG
jgi:quercetin dioxygenase-like cupin family protein